MEPHHSISRSESPVINDEGERPLRNPLLRHASEPVYSTLGFDFTGSCTAPQVSAGGRSRVIFLQPTDGIRNGAVYSRLSAPWGCVTLKTTSLQALQPTFSTGGENPEHSNSCQKNHQPPNIRTAGEHPEHSYWNESPDLQIPNFCTGEKHAELSDSDASPDFSCPNFRTGVKHAELSYEKKYTNFLHSYFCTGEKHADLSDSDTSPDFSRPNFRTGKKHAELSYQKKSRYFLHPYFRTGEKHANLSKLKTSPDFPRPNFCTGNSMILSYKLLAFSAGETTKAEKADVSNQAQKE
ncbi:hypothetical protein AMEX_G23993 [Astyanax mexicanus]|uniref:Uncharacterized protein n=2 Tax=Astyanax mexicanus TaxID=7994 RepID=A0A8T2KS66_ASTMX|nr:hypothetical protein AMEX_G23993 [Astyanax mexicanus]